MKRLHLNWIGACLLVAMLAPADFLVPAVVVPLAQAAEEQTQADRLYQEGEILVSRGEFADALVKFEAALPLFRTERDRSSEAACWVAIGYVKNRLADYAGAIEAFETSLPMWREIEEPVNEGKALNNLGAIYDNIGQYKRSLQYYNDALAIQKNIHTLDGRAEQGRILNNMGKVFNHLGQYEEALKHLQQALVLREEVKDIKGKGATLANIGASYDRLGQSKQALEYYEQALEIAQEFNIYEGQGSMLNAIGSIYTGLRQYQNARKAFEQALLIQQRIVDQAGQGITLNNIAILYENQAQHEQALNFFRLSLAVAQEINDQAGEATTLNNMGEVYREIRQYEQALNFLRQALAIEEKIGDSEGKARTLTNTGSTYEQLGNPSQAIAFYRQAIDVVESIQSQIKISELKTTFVNGYLGIYDGIIDLLWEKGDLAEAFNYVERARARAFLDQLRNGPVNFRAGADITLLKQEQELKGKIAALRTQMVNLHKRPANEQDANAIADVQEKLTNREKDYANLLTQLRIQSPEIASLVSVDTASLDEIQRMLDADTTLVEYFVTEKRTLAFIITRNSFKPVALYVKPSDLAQQITAFRNFVSRDNPHPDSLQKLWKWLIADLKVPLTTSKITIVPYGVLHYLPFAALSDGKRYLIDDYALVTLPSASMLRYLPEKRKPDTGTLLALGNPIIEEPTLKPLPFAEQEVKAIGSIYGTKAEVLVGPDATESAVWSKAGRASILLLAAHSKYNDNNPLFSTLYLARDDKNDGRLEVQEIYGLDLRKATNLVVLSACQTQINNLSLSAGKRLGVSAGDEVVSLNRAFLYAGTPSVISSLWSVDDESTNLLMERFYIHLRIESMSKAEALRQAQQEVRAKYPHPYYWAAFVLTGDGS